MRNTLLASSTLSMLVISLLAASQAPQIAVESGTGLELIRVVSQAVTYRGQKALRLTEAPSANNNAIALVNDVQFQDGTIDVDVAGLPAAGSNEGARGFVGVVFRSTAHASAYDCFYIRPTNGRADDQLRRNHATQYVSEPAFPWQKLRTEAPGVYESYADLETGAWTHLKIEINGVRARMFVNGAAQPALIVNDLKRGVTSGQIGLWIGPGTEAHFKDLRVTSK
jgi:hypothetical protein